MDSANITLIVTSFFGVAGVYFGQRKGTNRKQRLALSASDMKWKIMEDYSAACRAKLIENGITPPPWPQELKDLNKSLEDAE